MEGYSAEFDENCATARLEGVDASFKDLAEVCGRIRGKDIRWCLSFLEQAAKAEIPVLYKRHNKRLGHRRELGGKKGRYPKKSAAIVLKVLKSAIANGMVKGLGESYTVLSACANKKTTYPRLAPKGRRARSNYELARIEVILRSKEEVPKGVEVKVPQKEEKPVEKKEVKPEAPKPPQPTPAELAKKKEEGLHVPKHPPKTEHKHAVEKEQKAAHAHHERQAFEHGKGKKTIVKRED